MLVAQQSPTGSVETTIRRLEDQWRAAQQSNDTAAFRKLLAPEVAFIGTSGNTWVLAALQRTEIAPSGS